MITNGATNGAKEHRFRIFNEVEGFVGKRSAVRIDGRTAKWSGAKRDAKFVLLNNWLEHVERGLDHFGADEIAWQDNDVVRHNSYPSVSAVLRT